MIHLFIFSAITALIITILFNPFLPFKLIGKNDTPNRRIPLKFVIGFFVIVFINVASFYYFTNLDYNFTSLWIVIMVASILGAIIANGWERKVKLLISVLSLLTGIYFSVAFVFNANQKYEQAKMEIKEEIEVFDETKKPASVPPSYAENKMKKAFSQVPNTSYYELGRLQIQKVNDDYVYVAPVEFSTFWRWFKGKETPGYFMVSATDSSSNPVFIKQPMSYTPSSFFNKDVTRYMRLNNPNLIFYGDVQLEIDEDQIPYYIRSYGSFITARDGFKVEGIVMVNAQTGQMNSFTLEEIPDFIDGAIAPEVVSLNNSYYGKYEHGFLNSIFSKKDIKLPSDEGITSNVSPIFDSNGQMYYFTDFTSPKKSVDSMLGYSLTNAKTGEATYYTGTEEQSYMDSSGALQIVEKEFIEKKWFGQMPIIYNFYQEASWLVPVLDTNGFLQNYFIVSASNPEISAYGSTPNEALRLYKTALTKANNGTLNSVSTKDEKTTTGTVIRVYKEKVDDNVIISFYLSTKQNFVVNSLSNPLAIYLTEGDAVTFSYYDTGEQFLPVKELTINGLE